MDFFGIGERIRKFRLRKKLTQKELAELIGRKSSVLSLIERNSRNISVKNLQKIAKALGVTTAELVCPDEGDYSECISLLGRLEEEDLKKARDYLEYLTSRIPPKGASETPPPEGPNPQAPGAA